MTFKDLKRINSSNQQQTQSFVKLQNKPFWIWNIEEHKLEDVRTKGECCFNHIIGLPTKEGLEKPIFDYHSALIFNLGGSPILFQQKIFEIKQNLKKILSSGDIPAEIDLDMLLRFQRHGIARRFLGEK